MIVVVSNEERPLLTGSIGGLAQLVERLLSVHQVACSIHAVSTFLGLFWVFFEGRLQIFRAITTKFQVEHNLEIDAIQKQKADERQLVPAERPITYVENFNSCEAIPQ